MGKPKGKGKKVPNNSDKILLIVENSEELFFQQYFNYFIEKNHAVKVVVKSSGSGNKCDITNFTKISKKIENFLQKDNYKAVFLMIDLESKCFTNESNHHCLVKLKQEYLPKYRIEKSLKNKFYLFVVCNAIESWFLTIDKSKRHTNKPKKNHKKEMMNHFKVKSEPQIVQRMIQELKQGKVELDFSKNKSLEHFIKKLKEFNENL